MKDYIKLLSIFCLFIFLVAGCMPTSKPAHKEIEKEEPETTSLSLAPDFILPDTEHNLVTLSSYRDRQAVILFFWTTWCPYCRRELKSLNDKYPQLQKDNVELLAINIGEPAYRVENFIGIHSLNFKVLLDKDTDVAYSYDILGIPTYVFLNKQGDIAFRNNYLSQDEYKQFISNNFLIFQ